MRLSGGWERKQRRIEKRLHNVQREVQAVQGAIESIDDAQAATATAPEVAASSECACHISGQWDESHRNCLSAEVLLCSRLVPA